MQAFGLLLKVLWSPAETMFLISKNPRVLAPMLFLSAFSLLAGSAVLLKVDSAELAIRTVEKSVTGAQLPEEQKDRIRATMTSPIVRGFSFASTVIAPLFTVAILAAIYFTLFTVIGREGGFKAFFSITAFGFIPSVFRQIAVVLTVFVVPTSSLMPDELGSVSPAIFLDRDSMSPLVFTTLNTIDVISVWILILLVIGYRFVADKSVSKPARAIAVFSVFLVYACLRLAAAAIRGI